MKDRSRQPAAKIRTKAILAAAVLLSAMFLTSPVIVGGQNDDSMPPFEYRSIDGMGNNLQRPDYGSAGINLLRISGVDYADGISLPAGGSRMSPREISNIVIAQSGSIPNSARASDYIWQWGQFLDHDMDLTPPAMPLEPLPVDVPDDDEFFDQDIPFNRSLHDGNNPREQINVLTAFIDASQVYGSDPETADSLRTFSDGKLKTSDGDLLPMNDAGLFAAGDVRVNEQIGLTAVHTLFMREHNRLAEEIATKYPGMNDEEIYQTARKIVGAQIQVITYKEYLPLLLGKNAIPKYKGYNEQVNPGISTEFSAAAFRFGHSMLSPTLLCVENGGEVTMVKLRNAFFNPGFFTMHDDGVDCLLLGLALGRAQELDSFVIDDVRNFLFVIPGGGLDLPSLNMQRGRDHGLSDYNSVRDAYGLAPVTSFAQISRNRAVQNALALAYNNDVNNIDLWVGVISEDEAPGALVGKTGRAILADQFIRLRDGDRFWYQNDPFFLYHKDLMKEVEGTTLAEIIQRNTDIDYYLKGNAFKCEAVKSLVPPHLKKFCKLY